MIASPYETFEFVLPEFRRPEGYNDVGLYEAVKRCYSSDTIDEGYGWKELQDDFPWLRDILPPDAYMANTYTTAEENTGIDSFRISNNWHVDVDLRDRSALAATSTPTLYAECNIVVNRSNFADFTRDDSFYGYQVVLLGRKFGNNWLERFAGLTDEADDTAKLEVDMLKLTDIVVAIEGLKIVQAMPGVIAEGVMSKTLHKSAPRHPSSPTRRVFIRGLYASSEEALLAQ